MKNNMNWNVDMLASPPCHFPSNTEKRGNVPNTEDQPLHDNKLFYFKSPQKIGKQTYISPLRLIQSPINSRLSPSLFDDIGLASMVSQGRSSVVNQKKPAFDRQIFGDDDSCEDSQFNGNGQLTPAEESSNEKDFSSKQKLNKCKSQSDIHTTAKKAGQYTTLQKKVTEQKKIRPRDKGLRRLSSRAFEIVQEMKTVTYKDVASKLVQQLYLESQLDDEGKDEQNIKRRVYDALNVLIALGILRKDGRKITAQIKGKKKYNQLSTPQQHSIMMESYARQKHNVLFLKQKLADMKKKYSVIKNTIERNKHIKYQQDEIIRFPFIGALVKNFKQEKMAFSQDSISLVCDNKLRPFGDVDSLNLLDLCKEKKYKIQQAKKQNV